MRVISLAILASLVGGAALAEDGSKGFGIYGVNPDLTTGEMEFFREVYVDPATFPGQLTPKVPAPEGAPERADLSVRNGASAWVDLTINGTKVGKIGPLTTVVIHGVKSGTYEVSMTAPNGFTLKQKVATEGTKVLSAPLTRDPAVTPLPLLEGQPPAVEQPGN